MSQPDWNPKVGDKVVMKAAYARAQDRGVVWEVEKLNPVNHLLRPLNGGRKLRCPAYALEPFTGEATPSVPFTPVEFFSMGEIVTFRVAPSGSLPDQPFVVLADKGDKVNVAKLGGDNDKYFRARKPGLVRRDVTWLKDRI